MLLLIISVLWPCKKIIVMRVILHTSVDDVSGCVAMRARGNILGVSHGSGSNGHLFLEGWICIAGRLRRGITGSLRVLFRGTREVLGLAFSALAMDKESTGYVWSLGVNEGY